MRIQLLAFLLVAVMIVITIPPATEAQSVDSVTYLMGDIPQGRIVGGIVHNITIDLDGSASNVTLIAYAEGGFSVSNYTNNYSWTYDSGTWTDNIYDYYMKEESNIFGNTYCFHVAIDSQAKPGTWRWIVEVDGVEEYNNPMLVVAPKAEITMSAPTFYPRIFPYGEGYYNSWNSEVPVNSSFVRTANTGNVPLDMKIYYDSFNSLFATTNGTGTYLPGENREHYVEFQAQSWSPRKFIVKGFIHGTPQLVMTPDTISFIVALQTSFDVVVTVARQGYEIYQMDGVTVQYKKFYSSKYTEEFFMDMYLTGNKSVYLSGETEDLTLNFMLFQEEEHTDPLLMVLSDDVEQFVRTNITCSVSPAENQASILAYADFNLELEDDTGSGDFRCTVVVASIPDVIDVPPLLEPNVLVLIIIVIVFVAIGLVLFRAQRKTEADNRKDLEDRIRQKKEQSRKRR